MLKGQVRKKNYIVKLIHYYKGSCQQPIPLTRSSLEYNLELINYLIAIKINRAITINLRKIEM